MQKNNNLNNENLLNYMKRGAIFSYLQQQKSILIFRYFC